MAGGGCHNIGGVLAHAARLTALLLHPVTLSSCIFSDRVGCVS